PRDAIVAESADERVRGKAYGFHRAMDGIGSVMGAVLAFLLLPVAGYRNIFLFAFIPAVIAVSIILLVREKKSDIKKEKRTPSLRVSFRELPRNLKLFIAVSAIFAMGHFGYAFLLLRAKNIGLTDQKTILLYVLFYIVYVLCSIPSGILSDRIGRKPVLMTGYLLFAITAIGLIFSSDIYSVVFLFAIYGIFYAMIDGTQRAFVVDLAPSHLRATALGTFHTAIGTVALPGGFIAGMLWDKISPEATFMYGFILAMLSLSLFAFVKRNEKA
ncbi:MAG: MFS transporter, partial [Thermoplasmata archaeon]|nr:MFS transporter [Thermoplasmata archaeon]